MSERPTRYALWLLLAGAPTVIAQSGGGYDLHWSVSAAGGGAMTGAGGYALEGTAGQAQAQGVAMTGGGFALRGGFWRGAPDVIFRNGFEASP